MGLIMLLGALVTWFAPEPRFAPEPPESLKLAFREPIREFFGRPIPWAVLGLIVFYKLGDAFAARQNATLLTQKLGFVPWEIGLISQTIGPIALILGAIFGGLMVTRVHLLRALLWFGLFQAVTNLGFLVLMEIGRDRTALGVIIGLENFAQGMGATAFVALLMSLCDARFSATQYALFTALAAFGKIAIGPVTGFVVSNLGWVSFFWVSILVSLPGLGLLLVCRTPLSSRLEQQQLEYAEQA
jgi:PAT family beta-lactamase induction signal transducer AmpG